jgi:hypothetical protein
MKTHGSAKRKAGKSPWSLTRPSGHGPGVSQTVVRNVCSSILESMLHRQPEAFPAPVPCEFISAGLVRGFVNTSRTPDPGKALGMRDGRNPRSSHTFSIPPHFSPLHCRLRLHIWVGVPLAFADARKSTWPSRTSILDSTSTWATMSAPSCSFACSSRGTAGCV